VTSPTDEEEDFFAMRAATQEGGEIAGFNDDDANNNNGGAHISSSPGVRNDDDDENNTSNRMYTSSMNDVLLADAECAAVAPPLEQDETAATSSSEHKAEILHPNNPTLQNNLSNSFRSRNDDGCTKDAANGGSSGGAGGIDLIELNRRHMSCRISPGETTADIYSDCDNGTGSSKKANTEVNVEYNNSHSQYRRPVE
jgi:hypothetical protein